MEHRTLDEKENAVNQAYEYYKNLYLNFYGGASASSPDAAPPASPSHAVSTTHQGASGSSLKNLLNRQDINELISPETTVSLSCYIDSTQCYIIVLTLIKHVN